MKHTIDIPKLFAPNAHSVWKIRRLPCEDEDTLQTLTNVYGRFFPEDRDARFIAIERIDEGVNSENFWVRVKSFRYGISELILRRSTARGDRLALDLQSRLQNMLYRSVAVPKPHPVRGECDGFVYGTEAGCWQCSQFIPGDHFRGTHEELAEAARATAGLHIAMRAYAHTADFPATSYGTMDPREWDDALAQIPGTDVEELTRARDHIFRPLIRSVETFLDTHRGSPLLAEQLVHADLTPQNFLMRDGKVAAIIDFGNACYGRLGMDIGNTCHRLVRQFVVQSAETGETWQTSLPAGLRIFLDAYRDADPTYPREAERALPVLMREILLRKIGFNLQGCVNGNRTMERAAEEIGRFIGLLDEVHEIETHL